MIDNTRLFRTMHGSKLASSSRQGEGFNPPARRAERGATRAALGTVDKPYVFDGPDGHARRSPTCSPAARNSSSITSCSAWTGRRLARAAPSGRTTSTALTSILRTATSPCSRSPRRRSIRSKRTDGAWAGLQVGLVGRLRLQPRLSVTSSPEEFAKGDVFYNYAWMKIHRGHRADLGSAYSTRNWTARSTRPIPLMPAAST